MAASINLPHLISLKAARGLAGRPLAPMAWTLVLIITAIWLAVLMASVAARDGHGANTAAAPVCQSCLDALLALQAG